MPSHLPRLLAATGLAVTVLTLAACSQPSGKDRTAASPAAGVPGSTAQLGDGAAPGATITPVGTATKERVAMADGRWPGFIAAVGEGTVSMDLVEFLTGEAAAKAWQQKYPDSGQDTPDNDYFIVNDNKKLRKLPFAASIVVEVVGETGPGTEATIAAAELRKHFGDLLGTTMFWFTVRQGEVTKIEEQFLP